MKRFFAALMAASIALLAGCSDADMASHNLSRAADMFEIQRRIIFINGITDKYLLQIEGRCSLGNYDNARRMSVTCKTGEEDYKKHYLGTSDNVTFIAEQLEGKNVSRYHYRVIFKPQAIVPEIDFRGNAKELTTNRK